MRARVGILLLLAVFAGAFVGIRYAAPAYPPGALALLRFGIASAVLAAYQLARRGRLSRPAIRDVPGLAATGLFGVTLYHLALNAGERTVSAASASLLVNTTPIFAALLAMAALRERPCPRSLVGIGIGFVGAAIVSLGEAPGGIGLDPGALLVVAAGLAAALYYVLEKPYLARYRPLDVTAWGFWAGTVLLLPFAGELAAAARAAPLPATLAVAWLGVFPAAIGYVAWSHVLARMEVSKAAALLYLIPPLAALEGWALLGEPVGAATALGGGVTIAGVALVSGAPRRRAASGEVDVGDGEPELVARLVPDDALEPDVGVEAA